jgi:hypothetical protein
MEFEDLKRVAMNIVNQLFDEADVSIEKRQEINDKCDDFVLLLLARLYNDFCEENGIEIKYGFTGVNDCSNSKGTTGTAGSEHSKKLPPIKKWYDNNFINKKTKHKK